MEATAYFAIAAALLALKLSLWIAAFLAIRYIIRDAIDRAKT